MGPKKEIIYLLITALCLIAMEKLYELTEPGHLALRTVKLGDSVSKVKLKLQGDSRIVLAHEYHAADAPSRYYVEGFQYEERLISYKVLIYRAGAHKVAYFYINQAGVVEYIYIGKS